MKAKSLRRTRRLVATIVGCAAVLLASAIVAIAAPLNPTYTWYTGHEAGTDYVLTTANQVAGFAELVNGTADIDNDGTAEPAVDFTGETVKLGRNIGFMNNEVVPIGSVEHPFNGAFDGQGYLLDNFSIVDTDTSAPADNIGFFGYVGAGGSIANVRVGEAASLAVARTAEGGQYISNVGLLVGNCRGTIANCSNAGDVTVTSDVPQRSKDDLSPVRNVGGLAGQCAYDITDCSNSGDVSVSQTSVPDLDIMIPILVSGVGGVVGFEGDATRLGDYETHIPGDAALHGSVVNCSNTGGIFIDTPQNAGKDRFGVEQSAEGIYIGGVVGYSQGSVLGCTNGKPKAEAMTETTAEMRDCGYIDAENSVMAAGVVGSLRGVFSTNYLSAKMDDGSPDDPLLVADCTNYGDVYARANAAGIAGKCGSYGSITRCLNLNKESYFGNRIDTFIVATRWNKPTPGGIAGVSNGNVSYCANFGTVASATHWTNEADRTYERGSGYYASGISGALVYFESRDEETGERTQVTPIPEVFGCYNAGLVDANADMRQRGIVGDNNGHVHDNVLVKGLVYADKVVYGDAPEDSEASGTVGTNLVLTADEFRGSRSAEALELLNANGEATGWQTWWVSAADAQAGTANDGFPFLNTHNPWTGSETSILHAQVSLAENAPYTGGESVPAVNVVLDGTELSQNVDFRVIPQAGAIEPSTGGAYQARVEGIGRYKDMAEGAVTYDIVAGDLATCSVVVTPKVFNFEPQMPEASSVKVTTPAGTTVDPSEYSFDIVDPDTGAHVEAVDARIYTIRVTAEPGSIYFTGTLDGAFRVRPATFREDVDFDNAKIVHMGEEKPWVDSTETGETDDPSTVLRYTGVSVQPTVSGITYKGHELVEGVDYKVIYGNAASDDDQSNSHPENNMGVEGGTSVGSVTVRYMAGSQTNYSSYAIMVFKIVDDGGKIDLAGASYDVEEQVADGLPLEPVRLFAGKTELAEGVDYEISYSDNVEPGTAHFTATGIGRFEGTLEGTFEIVEGPVYTILYEYAESRAAAGPYVATVTGVEYNGPRDSFTLTIPETVEHDGKTYTVTRIGDNAFGGSGNSAYTGSLANESKLKVANVRVPATVTDLGSYAFGYGGSTSSVASYMYHLKSVSFAEGSALTTIGNDAFKNCRGLESITLPENLDVIGARAFMDCTNLKDLYFKTAAADKPSQVATGNTTGAFRNMMGVTVHALPSAEAVQAIAEENAPNQTGNPNAGRNFSFEEWNGTMDLAALAQAIADAQAAEKDVAVSVDGADVYTNVQWTTAEARSTFDAAIAKAQQVLDSPASSQRQIDAAAETLGTATAAYNACKQAGTKPVPKTVAHSVSWKRVWGATAPITMQAVAKEFGKTKYAVVTTDASYKDALAASALAGKCNGLVLMTKKGSLTPQTKTALKNAGVKTVYVVGSTNEVSAKVATALKSGTGVTKVTRVAGSTPSQRAVAAAKVGGKKSDTIIIATQNGFQDALSIAPYSYATKSPILYAETNKKLSTATVNFIKGAKYKKAIVVGGPIALPASIDTQLKKAGVTSITRLAGANAYVTSQQIANWTTGNLKNGNYGTYKGKALAYVKFQPTTKMVPNKLAVSTGQNWLDALAGAAVCGKNRSVMLLADAKGGNHYANAVAFCTANRTKMSSAYVFGGTSAVNATTWNALVAATKWTETVYTIG